MLNVARLRKKPRHFQAFTGITVSEFDKLLQVVTPAYEEAQQQRQNRPQRHRMPGAGRHFALDLPQKLLMGLVYLRLYVGQNLLSYLFDLDQSNISRELSERLLPLLLEVLPVPLRDAPLRNPDKIIPMPVASVMPLLPNPAKSPNALTRLQSCWRHIPKSRKSFSMPRSNPFPNPKTSNNANAATVASSKIIRLRLRLWRPENRFCMFLADYRGV